MKEVKVWTGDTPSGPHLVNGHSQQGSTPRRASSEASGAEKASLY